jgi:histidinol-phosphatase (PHP family)
MAVEPWKVSLHGGHSGEFCEHAEGHLREVLEAAVAAGYHTFGVSEHAPRSEARFLYDTELAKGYTVERLLLEFEAYAREVATLSDELADRLTVLRGFEAEIVPAASYREEMTALRERHGFVFMVGSVHWVNEIAVDGPPQQFARGVESCGGLQAYAVQYYRLVAEMVEALRPEVVGHLDLIRRNAPADAALDSPPIRQAAEQALEAVRQHDAILDLNIAGIRKGLGSPYPAPWLVQRARQMDIGFCFGADSHSPSDVDAGIDESRQYLVANGVDSVTYLTREEGAIVRKRAPL